MTAGGTSDSWDETVTVGTTKGDKNPEHSDDTVDIVDAEVVHEETAPPSDNTQSMKTVKEPTAAKAGKAGWISAGFLAVFVGGIFAAPYFEAGMISLGLRSASPVDIALPPVRDMDSVAEITTVKNDISDLKTADVRYREILAQFEDRAAAQLAEIAAIRRDIELLAGASESTVGTPSTTPADMVRLKAELAELRDDFARLSVLNAESDPAVSQLSGALALARAESAQLQARLTAIETSVQQVAAGALEASPRGRLVLALSRMKDRAMTGLSFAADLTGLRADLAELPALDQQLMGAEIAILDRLGGGIRPYVTLVRDYDTAVAAALRAGEKADGSFLQSLFTSRRTDSGAVGDDAIFLQAERRLLARDVAGAVAALRALEGAVSEAMEPWRTGAEAYVAVDKAFDRLIKATAHAGPALPVAPTTTGETQ